MQAELTFLCNSFKDILFKMYLISYVNIYFQMQVISFLLMDFKMSPAVILKFFYTFFASL